MDNLVIYETVVQKECRKSQSFGHQIWHAFLALRDAWHVVNWKSKCLASMRLTIILDNLVILGPNPFAYSTTICEGPVT